MTSIEIQQVGKVFQGNAGEVTALEDVSLELPGKSFVSLVGPSGCGKSTLLNILAGIDQPTSGTITMSAESGEPRLGYVFQTPRLLPWRTVMQNMLFVHETRDEAVRERCREYLHMVGLSEHENSFPNQLSGGMQQRVGVARAFALEPTVLLMDEPFSHLDAITGRQLRRDLHQLWLSRKKTVLFVTHDIAEAVELSEQVVVLAKGGRVRDVLTIDLPFPREAGDQVVARKKAELLQWFDTAGL